MSFFDKFRSDGRKKFAALVAKLYRTVKTDNPRASEKRIAEIALGTLYSESPMQRKAFLSMFLGKVSNVYDLAYAIFDADQHTLGKDMLYQFSEEGIAYVEESYRIIDMELTRLGFPKPSNYERTSL
jgi:ABC-type transporter MlaC component